MPYHHGTETTHVNSSLVAIGAIDNAIVGIVGTAPIGAVNELIKCQSDKDFAQFGNLKGHGFTLPDAFEILKLYGAGTFYVINVLDPVKHSAAVADEVVAINEISLVGQTEKIGLQTLTLKDGVADLVVDKDYVVSLATGAFTLKALPTSRTVTASYTHADPTKITTDDIKGGYDLATNRRTGWDLMRDGFQKFGADASILGCPKFGQEAEVARYMEALGDKLGAIPYIQAPRGITPSTAITGRGPMGVINLNTAAKSYLFYDHVNGGEELATHGMGLRMWVDVNQGYWHSISNKELKGVISTEVPLTARVDDIQSETNQLNAQGITTVFNSFGTGYRMWGNRLANFPAMSTGLDSFEVCWRTRLNIDAEIRRACLVFVDRGIDNATIDSVLESIDAYLRRNTGDDRPLLGGSVWWSESNNESELAQGHYYIKYKFTPKVPGERITMESEMTSEYLGVLNDSLQGGA